MASNNSSASKSKGNGAAEEPSSSETLHDTTDGKPRKGVSGDGKDKGKAHSKTKSTKGKTVGRCANCHAEGATRTCSQCHSVMYCNTKCQKVRKVGGVPCAFRSHYIL